MSSCYCACHEDLPYGCGCCGDPREECVLCGRPGIVHSDDPTPGATIPAEDLWDTGYGPCHDACYALLERGVPHVSWPERTPETVAARLETVRAWFARETPGEPAPF